MRFAVLIPAYFVLMGSNALPEPVACLPAEGGRPRAEFEVWPDPLPAPDYLDGLDECFASALMLTQTPAPPASLWAENQRAVYTNALKKQRVDIIVAPFQIQGYGLERTERAIMSADLAYHLDSTARVADPFLTGRALGEGARRYDRDDIIELARAVGAQTAIVGYVGHDRAHRMTITVEILDLQDGGVVETSQRDWRGVKFTHYDPPFVVFHRMLPSMLEQLSLPVAKQQPPRQELEFPNEAAFSFADLATDQHGLSQSLALSLLGTMAATSDGRSRERLFERALVASWHFDAPNAEASFLRAYALLNLEHRPAALALINGAITPEVQALRAVLNGDLPGAAKAAAEVENPLKQLMLAVHVDDLRHKYEREDVEEVSVSAELFGENGEDWFVLGKSRSNDESMWRVDESAMLKHFLDEVYPVAGLGVQSVLGGGFVVGAAVDDVAVDVASMRHVARFVESAAAPVCCSPDSAGVSNWDLVSLLEGRTEARMGKYLYLTSVVRAAPETATDAIERYRDVFEGHPLFALSRADHAVLMAEQSDGDALRRWQRDTTEQASVAIAWSPGQNTIAHRAALMLGPTSGNAARYVDSYGFDYPRRSYWSNEMIRASGYAAVELSRALRDDALPYARTDIEAFKIRTAQEQADKPMLQAQLESRMIGHPGRALLVGALRPYRPPSSDNALADAQAAVAVDPANWDVRYWEGRKLIEGHDKLQEGYELMLAYPPFHVGNPTNAVRVSNAAYDAGSIFYWGGHEELAIPFYEIASKLQTGAGSQITSEIRLNILKERYRLATAGSYARAQRYPDAYPFRDLLSFMHALGLGEEAWGGFSQVATSFDNPQIWVSALVGQRMQGLPEPEIRAWLKQPGIRDARFRNNLFAPRYAVLVNASDHMPPEDLGALVEEIEGEPAGRVVSADSQTRPHPEAVSDTIVVRRSTYANSVELLPIGTPVKSEFAFFGAAYAAIRYGRFDAAVAELNAMSEHYPIEASDYSFALPYFAWALAKTGDAARLEKFIVERGGGTIQYFDAYLSRAFFHGVRKEVDTARDFLARALRSHPFTDHRPVLIEYQWAEACEWLYRETGDQAFADMLLAWIVSQQKVQPTHAWPYAMEYTYARDAARKRRALAMTLYLDPQSPRIRDASERELTEAKAWGAANNPFLQDEDPAEDAPTARVPASDAVGITADDA
jgi:hypothetical protein